MLPQLPENSMTFQYDASSTAVFNSSQFFEFLDEPNCGYV